MDDNNSNIPAYVLAEKMDAIEKLIQEMRASRDTEVMIAELKGRGVDLVSAISTRELKAELIKRGGAMQLDQVPSHTMQKVLKSRRVKHIYGPVDVDATPAGRYNLRSAVQTD